MREQYVSKVNWLVHLGREDVIDEIADEYERAREEWTEAPALPEPEVELRRAG